MVKQPDHELDDRTRRVELAAFLAGRFGKHVDQVFVGRAEQVVVLEILVPEPVFAEVQDQVAKLLVRHRLLADLGREVDVVQDA